MPNVAFSVNLRKVPEEAIVIVHNRRRPPIPMIVIYRPGANIARDDSANGVRDVY